MHEARTKVHPLVVSLSRSRLFPPPALAPLAPLAPRAPVVDITLGCFYRLLVSLHLAEDVMLEERVRMI